MLVEEPDLTRVLEYIDFNILLEVRSSLVVCLDHLTLYFVTFWSWW